MHQIRLRGPWNLKNSEHGVEVSRKFHASPGLEKGGGSGAIQGPAKTFFVLSSNAAFPLKWCLLNNSEQPCVDANFMEFGGLTNTPLRSVNSRFDLTGILLPFNEITFAWSSWPESWQPVEGPYTPNPHHLLHFDSWLEIID
jgi:hypothetical protein